jgi:LmbE family N-acetylglucosaminyl deacetylase
MNVLVIAAHPDDELLGCGGTVARLAQEGHAVYMSILGEGITSRSERREEADPETITALHGRSYEVARMLGSKELRMFGLPDNRFDTVPLLEVIKIVEGLVSAWHPEVIYTHHSGDLNIDHQVVNRAVLTATRPQSRCCVRDLYAFEIPSSTEWSFQHLGPAFRPNIFLDISSTLELKLKGMRCYESEVRAFPHPRSVEALTAIAKRWGSAAGCAAAEAFELIRSIR